MPPSPDDVSIDTLDSVAWRSFSTTDSSGPAVRDGVPRRESRHRIAGVLRERENPRARGIGLRHGGAAGILGLADDGGKARAKQRVLHLLHDTGEPRLDDLKGYGIDGWHMTSDFDWNV